MLSTPVLYVCTLQGHADYEYRWYDGLRTERVVITYMYFLMYAQIQNLFQKIWRNHIQMKMQFVKFPGHETSCLALLIPQT